MYELDASEALFVKPTPDGVIINLTDWIACPGNWTVITLFIDSYNPQYFQFRPMIISGLFTLAIIGLISNCSVIGYLLLKPRFWKSAFSVLVMQLAIADGMVCMFCLLADGIWNLTMEWMGGVELCRLVKFMQMFSLYASTMILTGMTVERCIAVTYPFTMSRPKAAMHRIKFISVLVWLLSAICSIPQAVIFHVEWAPICTEFRQCVTFGAYTEAWQEVAYTMSTLLVMFIVPLAIIITCFVIICTKLSQEAKLALGVGNDKDAMSSKLERKALAPDFGYGRQMYRNTRRFSLWTTFIVAVVFVLCWAPYYVLMAAYLFHFELSNGWVALICSFGMTSTVLNPLIYITLKMIQTNRLPFNSERDSLRKKNWFSFSRSSFSRDSILRRESERRLTLLTPVQTPSAVD